MYISANRKISKKTIISFPCTGNVFSILELKKNQLQGGKKYSIVLSANEIAEFNRLKNKTNTFKHSL